MLPPWLDPWLLAAADAWFDLIPRPRLPRCVLQDVRIISHRGERNAPEVIENSFAAFDPLPGRVYGLECDVRFSRDGIPLVFHDADLARIFACADRLRDLDFQTIRRRFPLIPSLQELVARYGERIHLLIEFKAEDRPQADLRLQRVIDALAPLRAARDFHLMSLDIPTLDWLRRPFSNCLVAIARHNVAQMSAYALSTDCAGMTGHYALLQHRHSALHIAADQWIGLGFPQSRHALRHALHQGARWIFCNRALMLQDILEREKKLSKA